MTGLPFSATAVDVRRPLAGLAVVCLALALTGLPYVVLGSVRLYMLIIPAMAGALAVALYAISRPAYVGFVTWVWFLTPFVRRLVDYGVGSYTESSLVMTAPYLVGGVGILGLWAVLTEETRGVRQAFVLPLVALVYALLVGAVQNVPSKVATDALEWGIPLIPAALILADWREYPRYRDVVLRTITLGMGFMGVYGLYQFFVLPPWDKLWMEGVGDVMINIGKPLPLEVRIFGTMNSPNPYAITLAVGLLGLLASGVQSRGEALVARLAAVPAGVALALSLVRSGWGAFVVGLFYVLFVTRSQNRWRVLIFVGLVAVAMTPILLLEPVAERVSERATTFTDLSNNGSFNERTELYAMATPAILSNPIGWGLGNRYPVDSGILRTLISLGWAGTALYVLGFTLLFLWAWRMRRLAPTHDPFVSVAAGIAVAVAATLPLGNSFEGAKGFYLWGFLALALAGIRYHSVSERQVPARIAAGVEGPADRAPEAVSG